MFSCKTCTWQAESSKKFPASFDHPFIFSHLANKAVDCTMLPKPTRFVQFQFCYILSTTLVGLPAKPPLVRSCWDAWMKDRHSLIPRPPGYEAKTGANSMCLYCESPKPYIRRSIDQVSNLYRHFANNVQHGLSIIWTSFWHTIQLKLYIFEQFTVLHVYMLHINYSKEVFMVNVLPSTLAGRKLAVDIQAKGEGYI